MSDPVSKIIFPEFNAGSIAPDAPEITLTADQVFEGYRDAATALEHAGVQVDDGIDTAELREAASRVDAAMRDRLRHPDVQASVRDLVNAFNTVPMKVSASPLAVESGKISVRGGICATIRAEDAGNRAVARAYSDENGIVRRDEVEAAHRLARADGDEDRARDLRDLLRDFGVAPRARLERPDQSYRPIAQLGAHQLVGYVDQKLPEGRSATEVVLTSGLSLDVRASSPGSFSISPDHVSSRPGDITDVTVREFDVNRRQVNVWIVSVPAPEVEPLEVASGALGMVVDGSGARIVTDTPEGRGLQPAAAQLSATKFVEQADAGRIRNGANVYLYDRIAGWQRMIFDASERELNFAHGRGALGLDTITADYSEVLLAEPVLPVRTLAVSLISDGWPEGRPVTAAELAPELLRLFRTLSPADRAAAVEDLGDLSEVVLDTGDNRFSGAASRCIDIFARTLTGDGATDASVARDLQAVVIEESVGRMLRLEERHELIPYIIDRSTTSQVTGALLEATKTDSDYWDDHTSDGVQRRVSWHLKALGEPGFRHDGQYIYDDRELSTRMLRWSYDAAMGLREGRKPDQTSVRRMLRSNLTEATETSWLQSMIDDLEEVRDGFGSQLTADGRALMARALVMMKKWNREEGINQAERRALVGVDRAG